MIVPEANRNIRYNRIRSDHLSREGRKLVLEIVSFRISVSQLVTKWWVV